jgi:hypothetical protein
MRRSAAAIATILSRLGVGRAPSSLVRTDLRHAQRVESSDQQLATTIGGSSKPIPRNGKAAASKVRVQLRFDIALLARADSAANHQGITRTAWLHRAAFDALEDRFTDSKDEAPG